MSQENESGEVWKDIEGFEGLYQVSNHGRIKSIRDTIYNHRTKSTMTIYREKILKPYKDTKGYLLVDLRKNGKRNTRKVHIIVAKTFIPNPDHLPQVNHKDENKQNPNADNLEWCTNQYNTTYGTAKQRMAEKMKKKVIQIDANGDVVDEWESIEEAAKALNVCRDTITLWCNGKVTPRHMSEYTFLFKKKEKQNE